MAFFSSYPLRTRCLRNAQRPSAIFVSGEWEARSSNAFTHGKAAGLAGRCNNANRTSLERKTDCPPRKISRFHITVKNNLAISARGIEVTPSNRLQQLFMVDETGYQNTPKRNQFFAYSKQQSRV
jgi:hypothetical protein